uniref:Uncharacterized protein n=1 Tax=Glossina palpalis gambiensis TaxID=67801 RepID=A0A1B0BV94_9MUSC
MVNEPLVLLGMGAFMCFRFRYFIDCFKRVVKDAEDINNMRFLLTHHLPCVPFWVHLNRTGRRSSICLANTSLSNEKHDAVFKTYIVLIIISTAVKAEKVERVHGYIKKHHGSVPHGHKPLNSHAHPHTFAHKKLQLTARIYDRTSVVIKVRSSIPGNRPNS